jgi:hypothetical protein
MAFSALIGESDFLQIRKQGATYVDKTAAITSFVSSPTKVFLFTRPRRFGKSTFMSTLRAFFQLPELIGEDTTAVFEDLAVWRSDAARAHHQRYPVLSLSFKDMQQPSWELALVVLQAHIASVARSLAPALDHPGVPADLRRRIDAMRTASPDEAHLHRHRSPGPPPRR